jgi:TIR domain
MEAALAHILVVGTMSPASAEIAAASMVGRVLARERHHLLIGSWPGVDDICTDAFISQVQVNSATLVTRFDNCWRRPGFKDPRATMVSGSLREYQAPFCAAAVQAADLCIIVGGLKGSRPAADALQNLWGRPAIPLPVVDGDSVELFLEMARNWDRFPTRDIPRNLFLDLLTLDELEVRFTRLLRAVTEKEPSIFLSYKQSESAFAAGRLSDALSAALGPRSVFLDMRMNAGVPIESIVEVARKAKVVLALLGPGWRDHLSAERDWMQRELSVATEAGVPIIPIVLEGAPVPRTTDFPFGAGNPLATLLTHSHWGDDVRRIIQAIEGTLSLTSGELREGHRNPSPVCHRG